MTFPSISIINFSSHLEDQQVQETIRAVNRQITEDFAPIWGSSYILRLHAAAFDPADENSLAEEHVRGESVIYLVDEASLPGALGYHSLNTKAIPFGFVFTDFIDDWTVTLSHEVLELIIDPIANILVPGPDPRDPQNLVLHSYEVCDAVERTSYEIDHVRVSNFITPAYFTVGDEVGTRNDFLGVGVRSFDAIRDSHLAFFDLSTNDWVTFLGQHRSTLKILTQRAMTFDRPKQKRPHDDKLQNILHDCQKRFQGLKNMGGITRAGRYREAASRMKLQMK